MFSLIHSLRGWERLIYFEGIVVKVVFWVEVQAELSPFQLRLVVCHLPLGDGRKISVLH